MLKIHANVFAAPSDSVEGPTVELRGHQLTTLAGKSAGPPVFDRTLPVTFEEAQQQLLKIDRIDCEPDGFFLYTGGSGESFWRLNGHMHEHEGKLYRVELNGECPVASFDKILLTLGWSDTEVVFELVQEGVTLSEREFRIWAGQDKTEVDKIFRAESSPTSEAFLGSSAKPLTGFTPWHITFGTYGTRLHGDSRPTVDKEHNQRGEPFLTPDAERVRYERESLSNDPVLLTQEQRTAIEDAIPSICKRGGWILRECAAAADHVHVVLDVRKEIHGERVRRLLKRWLTQRLNEAWPLPKGARWWAIEGSNKAIRENRYLENAVAYVRRQKTRRGG